ncbi:helix-turn-helix domain-containing protein [Microbulbifer sp. S227A]|uniref:helix-turn-helix domain-containing protein n=1 Tax=Microbulbifer sp. S227A TaxID=3415131 RepID=UPI003C7B0FE9
MRETCLNQTELAARWKISPRTLERWRWIDEGPHFPKIGGRVIYRLEDIEAFEREALKATEDERDGR